MYEFLVIGNTLALVLITVLVFIAGWYVGNTVTQLTTRLSPLIRIVNLLKPFLGYNDSPKAQAEKKLARRAVHFKIFKSAAPANHSASSMAGAVHGSLA